MNAGRTVPVKAAPVVLDAAWLPEVALKCVVRNCLTQLNANAGALLHSRNIEFLHQARVALRRMRSILRLRWPAEETAIALRTEFRWLSATLGPARDWDVLVESTLPAILAEYTRNAGAPADADPGLRRLLNAARRRRAKARKVAREALGSARFAGFVQSVESWLAAPSLPGPLETTLTGFAVREVRKRHKRLQRDGANLRQQTPEQRHQVRIATKRLRYAVEFCGSLFAAQEVKPYVRELAGLQDALGTLNDSVVARRLISGLPHAFEAAPFILGWLAARESDSISAAQSALRRIADCPRFWKAATPPGGEA